MVVLVQSGELTVGGVVNPLILTELLKAEKHSWSDGIVLLDCTKLAVNTPQAGSAGQDIVYAPEAEINELVVKYAPFTNK